MHIFIMSVTYLQRAEKIQWKLEEELISGSLPYQPLFTWCSHLKMAKVKNPVSLSKTSFSPLKFFKHIFSISVTNLRSVEKSKSSKRSWFHKICTVNHYLLGAVVEKMAKLVSLSNNIFSASNFFMHIFIMSVTYLQSAEKIQRKLLGVDFTKYALSTIIYLMQSSENG